MMDEPDSEVVEAPMVPLFWQEAWHENYHKCLNLYVAYLLVTGQALA